MLMIASVLRRALIALRSFLTERGTLNLREWTMWEWTIRHDVAGVDIAGVDNAAPCGKDGQCGSGQCSN